MKKTILIICSLLLTLAMNASVFYVINTGSAGDGTSWATAFTDIQSALTASSTGDEVWVQQGTYTLTSQLSYKSGVNVYGGFVGTEALKSERDNDPSLTIISHQDSVASGFRLLNSGDLSVVTTWDGLTFDGNNASLGIKLSGNCVLNNAIVSNCVLTNGSGAGVYMSSSDDSLPLVLSNTQVINNTLKISSANGSLIGGAGICVTAGSPLAEIHDCEISNNTIEGISSSTVKGMGAGVCIYEGVISNCLLDSNTVVNSVKADYKDNTFTAGAIAILPQKTDIAANNVLIEGCTITNSSSNARGGAITIDPVWGGQYHGNYTISKCTISNNTSKLDVGGAILASASAQTGAGWTLNIINSIISNNSSVTNAGGGIFINTSCILNITNSNIVNNLAGAYGAGGLYLQSASNHTIATTLNNVIVWGNVCPGRVSDDIQLKINSQTASVTGSAIQDYDTIAGQFTNTTFSNNVDLNADNAEADGPGFVTPSNAAGQGAADALTANWALAEGSVCIDAGTVVALDKDIIGEDRPLAGVSGGSALFDIGAYEYKFSVPTSTQALSTLDNSLQLYSSHGAVMVTLDKASEINLYGIDGQLIKRVNAPQGLSTINVENKGIYIVRVGRQTGKVVVY